MEAADCENGNRDGIASLPTYDAGSSRKQDSVPWYSFADITSVWITPEAIIAPISRYDDIGT
jgi:hypothetical protein